MLKDIFFKIILIILIIFSNQLHANNLRKIQIDNDKNNESSSNQDKKSERFALVFGVNKHNDRSPVLPAVNVDLERVKYMLINFLGFQNENIFTYLNEELTKSGYDQILSKFKSRLNKNDKLFIYVSSFGTNSCSPKSVDSILTFDGELLSSEDFKMYFSDFPKENIVFFFDSATKESQINNQFANKGKLVSKYVENTQNCNQSNNKKLRKIVIDDDQHSAVEKQEIVLIDKSSEAIPYRSNLQDIDYGGISTMALVGCYKNKQYLENTFLDVDSSVLNKCMSSIANQLIQDRSVDQLNSQYKNQDSIKNEEITSKESNETNQNPVELIESIVNGSDPSKNIQILTNKKKYKIYKNQSEMKDFVDISIKSNVDGFLYLLMLGSDKESLIFLLPNQEYSIKTISKNKPVILKSKLLPMGPVGEDFLLAVVADKELDLSNFDIQSLGPYSFIKTSERNLRNLKFLINDDSKVNAGNKSMSSVACNRSRNLKFEKNSKKNSGSCVTTYGANLISIYEHE